MESRHDCQWDNLGNDVADNLELALDVEIPTPADIANGLHMLLPWLLTAQKECEREIAAAYIAAGPPAGAITFPNGGGPPQAAKIGVGMGELEGKEGMPVNIVALIYDAEITTHQNEDGETIHSIGNLVATLPNTEAILALGKNLLAPLIKAWLQHCEPDRRKTAIMPETLATLHLVREPTSLSVRPGLEEIPANTGFQAGPHEQASLPNLAPLEGTLIPWLPLYYLDSCIPEKRNKGAPYVARIYLEAILAVPTETRTGERTVDIEFGELVKSRDSWLFPNGRYTQDRYPDVRRALDKVHNLRFPWEGDDGSGGKWASVVVRNVPRAWNAYSDKVVFEIRYPAGVNDRGPLVYRLALRILAQQSVLRWRAYLTLCYLWDRWGRWGSYYIQPTRPIVDRGAEDEFIDIDGKVLTDKSGKPISEYMTGSGDKRRLRSGVVARDLHGNPTFDITKAARERNPAANAYRVLNPDEIVELAFGPAERQLSQTAIRKRRLDAIKALRHLEKESYCTIEEDNGRYRILPPDGWGAGFDR
ncbi:MAG: hypothetical protein OXO48_19405 [Caldilineaceae bacterium]|nr:hypothetical protein [Caldilineaceae bacterium]